MRRISLLTTASFMALGVAATPAIAQDADQQEATGVTTNDAGDPVDEAQEVDTQPGDDAIVITGSRVKKDNTFDSISPLQVLETEVARDVGEFDAAQILQRSQAAAGQQIDATFQGFVLDNGPGSQTLNLRGLGANRTLLMINGRRIAPAGVEGAPTSPSINLLPSSLIARYDLLLDGASSIYGSDAVAGVGNVILRNDIDGFELFASGSLNEQSNGGNDYTISGAWGTRFDRGFIGIGAEYSLRDRIRLRDRDFLAGCDTHREIDQNGNILTVGLADNAAVQRLSRGAVSVSERDCKIGGISGRIFNAYNASGSIYFQADGQGNFPGYPNFPYADSSNAFNDQLDRDGDGIRDVDFQDVNTNGANLDQNFISEQKLYNVMAYGEYELGGSANLTPFFEALYSRAEINSDNTGIPQLFPSVPDINPFNPCNIDTNPDGVDCRLIDNGQNRGFPLYTPTGGIFGVSGFSLPVSPITAIRGDRNNSDVTQEQYRAVLGLKGDLPFISDSWTFEISGVYSRSEGLSIRNGIREDRLALALGLDPTGDYNGDGVVDNNDDGIADDYDNNVDVFGAFGDPLWIGPCGTVANPELAAPDLTQGCVAVNLFAPNALTGAIGDLTQAERDYLFDDRVVNTVYEQTILSGYATGELFELPAGPLSLVVGGEYRKDSIDTESDFKAQNGLFFGFFRDFGTTGEKYLIEGFAELDIPVFDNDTLGELDLNLSGRITDEEFYGTAGTYSLKGGWKPIPQLLLKASYGTSFRAPNLRENFLGGITGFTTVTDPCAVPAAAFQALPTAERPVAGYQADLDPRDPDILANCVAEGRDPTVVGINPGGTNTVTANSIEVANQGTLDLDPETSKSLTLGASIADNIGDFDFAFNVNYYSIKVEDSITELTAQFAVNQCYNRDVGTESIYCDQLRYDTVDRLLINFAQPAFLNQDEEKVRGLDFNANFGYNVAMGDDDLRLGLNLQANHLLERSTLFITDDGSRDFDDDTGEFGFPKWTGRGIATAGYKDFTFTWQTRWIGKTEQQSDGIDPLSDAFGFGPDGQPTGFTGDTCLGGGSRTTIRDAAGNIVEYRPNNIVPGDGVYCRDVGFADDYFVSSASVRYDFNDDITMRFGISNIFNAKPPLVDSNEVFAVSNVPIGNGYDLDGREFFASLNVKF